MGRATGYLAGLTLLHGRRELALELAEVAAPHTTALSGTLIRHAARGEQSTHSSRLAEILLKLD